MDLDQVKIPKPVLIIGVPAGDGNMLSLRCGNTDLGHRSPSGILQFLKGFRRQCSFPVDVRFDFPSENGPDFADGVDAANQLFPRKEILEAPE